MKRIRLVLLLSFVACSMMQAFSQIQKQESQYSIADTINDGSKYEVRRARAGIIVIDSGAETRAFEPFGGTQAGAMSYAEMVNSYKRAFGDSVAVYCMTIPNAVAYYCPEEQRSWTNNEKSVLDKLYASLDNTIIPVKIYDELESHKSEPIYSRTDHHWAPLGAILCIAMFRKCGRCEFQTPFIL